MDIRKWFGSKNKEDTVTTRAEASSPRSDDNNNTEPDPGSETEDLPSPPAAEEPSTSAAVRPPPHRIEPHRRTHVLLGLRRLI